MLPAVTKGLRETLLSVLERSHTPAQLDLLVKCCHAIAIPFLRYKMATGAVSKEICPLPPSDLAYDCIADLFQQNEKGDIVQIKAYFEGIDLSLSTDVELLIHLRRLVFSKVNQGIFRLYNETDPALGKIIRNIKLAVGTLQSFSETERWGTTLLHPTLQDARFDLPPYDEAELERDLSLIARPTEHIPGLMAKLSLLLRQQQTYCRAVPLSTIARVFRAIYARNQEAPFPAPEPEAALARQEMLALVKQLGREAAEEAARLYGEIEGLEAGMLDAYARVVEQALMLRYVEQDGEAFSYYRGLKAFFPDLSREEFVAVHKSKVEYLGRIAMERLVQRLRRLYQ